MRTRFHKWLKKLGGCCLWRKQIKMEIWADSPRLSSIYSPTLAVGILWSEWVHWWETSSASCPPSLHCCLRGRYGRQPKHKASKGILHRIQGSNSLSGGADATTIIQINKLHEKKKKEKNVAFEHIFLLSSSPLSPFLPCHPLYHNTMLKHINMHMPPPPFGYGWTSEGS